MHSPKHNGNRKPTVSAKNAQRRSVRQAHHIGARSAAYGTLLVTLPASIKTRGGACTAFVCRVMQKSNVFYAKQSRQKNISPRQHGKQANQRGGFACIVRKKENGTVDTATKNCQCNNFPSTAKCAPPAAKVADKCAMRAVPLPCKLLSVSGLRQQLRNVCNLCAKSCVCSRPSAKHGKPLRHT